VSITPEQSAAYYEARGRLLGEDLEPCELCDFDADCWRCAPSGEDEGAVAA
jgi:hypothetical protein